MNILNSNIYAEEVNELNYSRILFYAGTLALVSIAGIAIAYTGSLGSNIVPINNNKEIIEDATPRDLSSTHSESVSVKADTSLSAPSSVTPNSLNSAQKSISANAASKGDSTMKNELSADRITYQPGFYYEPITDTIKKRIYGLSYKEDCTIPYEDLRYVSVLYVDFNDKMEVGEIICNKSIAEDLVEIFYELYQAEYPIEQIRLIDEYNADDDLSCLDNNTSCFNYRVVAGTTKLSKHAQGLALDINPFYNPYVTYPNGVEHISPPGSESYADRNADFAYKIDKNDLCYQLFTAHGFTWGGNWKTLKDYQHFQK